MLQSRPLVQKWNTGELHIMQRPVAHTWLLMALVEASAPNLHLGTACFYGGWASLKQRWKTRKRCFLFTLPFLSACTQPWGYKHIYKYLRLHMGSSHPPSPQQKKEKSNSISINHFKTHTSNRGSAITKEYYKIINMQAAVGLGTGTPLGGGRRRIQKGHGEKRSTVDNSHPGRVAETVELLMAGSRWKECNSCPTCYEW